jgi:hypothetical protein
VNPLAGAYLRLARAMLTSPAVADPVAVRTAALLGRGVLERAVAQRLAVALPGTEGASMRAQLLCCRSVDERFGEDASHLHGALSSACHHHPYELGPSVDEMIALLDAVEGLTLVNGERSSAPPEAAGPLLRGPLGGRLG